MHKGQSELVEVLIIVVASAILLFLTYSFVLSGSGDMSRVVSYTHNSERLKHICGALPNVRIQEVNKTLGQIMGDSISENINMLSYGPDTPEIRVKEVLKRILDKYLEEGRYYLELTTDIHIGIDDSDTDRVACVMMIPLPNTDRELKEVFLYAW